MQHIRTRRLDSCPMCCATDTEHWAEGHDYLFQLTDQTFEYRRCRQCRVVYNADQPMDSDIGILYPDAYGPYGTAKRAQWIKLPGKLDRACAKLANVVAQAPAFARRMDGFYRLGSGERFLDFGCGGGKFLDRAKKLGCETVGIDFSEPALARVAARGHTAIHVSDADWHKRYSEHFTMVRMNHVIEHVIDPVETLRKLYAAMAPGGRIHVSTPNPESVAAETYKEFWFSLDCPRHLILLPPEQMLQLFGKTGFEQTELVHEPLTKDLARSWAYRKAAAGDYDFDRVEGLATDGLLNLRFALQARRAAKAGRSDRVHVFARKPLSNKPLYN